MKNENPKMKEIFYENGDVKYREFYLHGNRHREDGPAYETFCENGDVKYREFSIHDKELSKEEFRLHCLLIGNMKGLKSTYEK